MAWKQNMIFLGLALVSIAGGFLALAGQHLSVGPLMLVAGYCLLLPAYLWRTFNSEGSSALKGHGGE